MEDHNIDEVLLHFKDEPAGFSIRDSFNGILVLGGVGTGKSSGSGKTVALKYLSHGYGGIVLTAKPDELAVWQGYCAQTNRLDDLIIVEPGRDNYFSFLEYESRPREGMAFTDNIHQILKTVIRASEQRAGGRDDDAFWENSLDQFILQTISLCLLAYGTVTVESLYEIAQSAPRKELEGLPTNAEDNAFLQAFNIAKAFVGEQVEAWVQRQDQYELGQLSQRAYEEKLTKAVPDSRTLRLLTQFFYRGLYSMGEKTRSIIDFTFTSFLMRLLRDPIYSLFCANASTFTPEDTLDGKIIIINLPVKLYEKAGADSQILFKYIWQRAMERRNISLNGRPQFLFADESHLFLHEHDSEFQATARSSRIATTYISQNLPQYFANMGGDRRGEYKVKSFLGTLSTKIFHANSDLDTNEFASKLIGQAYVEDHSSSSSISEKFSMSKGVSLRLEYMVRPEAFGLLKTGGPENGNCVEAYIQIQGKKFNNKTNFKKISFNQ